MQKKNLSKDILTLVILTTITVITWIVLDIYRSLQKSVLPKILQEQLQPVNPNLDLKIIDSLKNRKSISRAELDMVPELTTFALEEKETPTEENKQEASPSAEELKSSPTPE